MPRKKKKGKKTTKIDLAEEEYRNAPHSFVFHRGHVGRNVKTLVHDLRLVMEPFTAKNLQVRKKNVLKDFVNVAGLLHVTHFMILTKTETSVNFRLCRLPRGPTMTFKVHNYCLTKDVVASLRKPNLEQIQYLFHPLLVMNNFSSDERHIKLMGSMFQNMFPSINVHKVKLNEVRRCVMINYNPDTKLIDFRHYNIKVLPAGVTRGVKKLMQSKIPDLGKYKDISEFVDKAAYLSESEAELDGPMNEVVLPQDIRRRGNIKAAKSAVRMTELGPRLTLQLVKIEEGLCDGAVMYHEFITKTEAELAAQKRVRENKKKLKEARKRQQAENVLKKQSQKEDHKQKSLAGMKRPAEGEEEDEGVEKPELSSEDDEDDDVAYYKEAVGQMPDKDSNIPTKTGRGRKSDWKPPAKKQKFDGKVRNSMSPGKQKQKFDGKVRNSMSPGKQKQKFDGKQRESKSPSKPFGRKNDRFSNQKDDKPKNKFQKPRDFKNRNKDDGDKKTDGKKKKLPRSQMTIAQKLKDSKKRKEKIKEKRLKKFRK